jgi:tRNA pseudouridine13 synthase
MKIYLAKVFEREPEDSKVARTFLTNNWNKEGFAKALDLFPKRLTYERRMIDYLSRYPNDFAGALRTLPKKLRKMFVNAFQSYVWNKVAVEIFGGDKEYLNLVGYDSNPDELSLKILEEEGIKVEDFTLPSMPELKCSGTDRKLVLKPEGLELVDITKDEFNEGKLKIEIKFSLPSGSYASVILKEVMKN